jgi:hypothetical protein
MARLRPSFNTDFKREAANLVGLEGQGTSTEYFGIHCAR